MPFFLCRWPNGDCSAVLASSEQDALIKLDEVANAEGCPLVRLDDFQVHFHLTDDGELALESFGEVTEEEVWEFSYPILDGVVPAEAPEHWSAQQREAVRQAVIQERARVHPAEVAEPETALGRDIKNQLGAPTAMVEEILRQEGGEMLRKLKRPRKPH